MSDQPTYGSLFSGIGGLDLGVEAAGFTPRWQVELDSWCRNLLHQRWPDVPQFEDVSLVDPTTLEPVDLIVGGFPCQPVSVAGRGLAQLDERWLWPHFERIIRGVRPRLVLVENVPGLLLAGRGMGDVLGGLAALGFDADWDVLGADALGAPHRRDRVLIRAWDPARVPDPAHV